MALGEITKKSVESAILEYRKIGGKEFLNKYGFSKSRRYLIKYKGDLYPSKAMAGVAHRYLPGKSSLKSNEFHGGEKSVVKKLKSLGFEFEEFIRNPDWIREEIILVLDLYLDNPVSPPNKSSKIVSQLSEILNKMHRLRGILANETLRNSNGIYLKMMNLRSLDSNFTTKGKVGMSGGGKLEKLIWVEYFGRRDVLKVDANNIKGIISFIGEENFGRVINVHPYEGEEGGMIMVLHKRYERDPKLIREKKKQASLKGRLACEICDFDFEKTYGALGANFIEVHHTNPLHMMRKKSRSKLDDLVLLCSNCHRMAHRRRDPFSISEIRDFWKKGIC